MVLNFTITPELLNTGLRGFPVGTCSTSDVRPDEGLYYRGQAINDFANAKPEEVIYLLFHGLKGSKEQIEQFSKGLHERAISKVEVRNYITSLPKEGTAMDLFSMAIMIAGVFEKTGNYEEDCLNLIAKIPEIAAVVINHHAGWGKTPLSNPKLGYMENFTHMLNVPNKDTKKLEEVFRLFNILHYDHGGGNLSTFVGKAIASSLEDMYGSIAGAMNALAGPRHGRANQDTLEFNEELFNELGAKADLEAVESAIRKRLSENKLVFGFGHAVLRVEDTRATVLYDVLKSRYKEDPRAKMALLLREAGPNVLKENPKISNPYPNVDAVSGTVLTCAGFPYPEYFTVLFGLSRVVGIAIQILHERVYARGGKGIAIYRPDYIYEEGKN